MPVSQLEWRAGKRQNKGEKGRRRATERCYRCYFSLDEGRGQREGGERIQKNYQPFIP